MNSKVSPNRYLSNSGVTPPPNRLTVNRKEAAAMLGISERLLWTWTNAGQIPHVRIGARVLYPVESLRQWLEQQTSGNGR
jgi:excisionase family DNA binding protein